MATTITANWLEEVSISGAAGKLKQAIPAMPRITKNLTLYTARDSRDLAFLAYAVMASSDKDVVVAALASAVAGILKLSRDVTGGTSAYIELTGLDVWKSGEDEAADVTSNIPGLAPVSQTALNAYDAADEDEIAALIGIYIVATCKKPTQANMSAFNEKRRGAASMGIIGELQLFVDQSPALTYDVIQKINASFVSRAPYRVHLAKSIIACMNRMPMGPEAAFMGMIQLTADFGMNGLVIVKRALVKNPWIVTEFPEIADEIRIVREAQAAIMRADVSDRSFLKWMWGSQFIPANLQDISNAIGICKKVLEATDATISQYGGGNISAAQEAVIAARMAPAVPEPITPVTTA